MLLSRYLTILAGVLAIPWFVERLDAKIERKRSQLYSVMCCMTALYGLHASASCHVYGRAIP